jgi:type II secretory pathway component PulC
MSESMTPEEKLLKLIRGQKSPEKKTENTPLPAVDEAAETQNQLKANGYNFIHRLFYNISAKRIVYFTLALSCIFLIIAFISPYFSSTQIQLPKTRENIANGTPDSAGHEKKPLEYYLKGVENQNIFGASGLTQQNQNPAAAATDLAKDITLVGIISGDQPQAVIEDKKNQKTYHLNKGQSFGEFRVEDIQEGKIILENNGKKYELYL